MYSPRSVVSLATIAFLLLPATGEAQATVATQGRWSSVITTPVNPVGAAALPDGKVLMWSSYDRYTFGANVSAKTLTAVFDPATGVSTERMVTETAHDMFCPGTSYLPDGRLLVTGGDTAARSSIYNPGTATWTSGGNMNIPRGYQGQVTVDDGRAFVLGGSWSGGGLGKNGETWWNNLWTYLPNALASVTLGPDPGGQAVADRHPWLFAIGGGKVVHVGPSAAMNRYDLNVAGGSTTALGNRADDQFSQNGTAVMYDIGKILKAGGAAGYGDLPATAGCYIINVNNGVSVTKTGSLRRARGMHNAVVLPNGEVLVMGGMPVPVGFSDTNSIFVAEMWNPTTGLWRDVASISVPRNYHSTALLLPDGRVFSGGGGLCGTSCSANHSDVQIYSPPYLFNADGTNAVRPTINTAPTVAYHGSTIDVATTGGTQFVLVRFGAVTHTVNSDQRRVPLSGTQIGAGVYRLNIPDAGIATPGNYMLFALNAAGVPSLAKTVNVQPPVQPLISLTSPTVGQSFTAPATIAINANVTDPSRTVQRVDFFNGATKLGQATAAPYTFSWTNVPAGSYTINATVVDSTGFTATASAAISVVAVQVNRPPVISLSSPANNGTYLAPASVVIAATASDPDGNLAKVEYFQGATKLGERTAAPFTFNWNNVLAGSFRVRAIAIDTNGLTAEAAADITVNAVAGRPPAVLQSLKGLTVPEPTTLASFVTNRAAAIALGKALFWDVQVSSDSRVACASCHFQAGADGRFRHQSNPGMNRAGVATFSYTRTRSGAAASGPDYRMKPADFPQYELSAAGDPNSTVVFSTTDVMGSQGVERRTLTAVGTAPNADACSVNADPVFGAFRQTTARNAPTVINAVFNLRNLYDGSANHFFNGVDKFGKRNTQAVIYRGASAAPQAIALDNSSLASQAVSVPVNAQEMSCGGRTWPQVGRRMLAAVPLARQTVAATDSVLSSYAAAGGRGLNQTYGALVQAAFAADLWNSATNVTIAGQSYTQREANFALFFGLALQMYQSTLVSNDAPLDRYFANYPSTSVANAAALTAAELQGLNLFTGKGGCVSCHSGPQLSNAGTPAHIAHASGVAVDRMFQGNGQPGLYDFGFYNIGVRTAGDDLGLGGVDAFGNPLSFTRQAIGGANKDGFTVTPCSFSEAACTPVSGAERAVVDGAFKTATLRNVALTGPYFHDGSLATLEDVVQFYIRRGNARATADGDTTGFGSNPSNLAGDFPRIELSPAEATALVQFLRTALTDERVAYERAPFDHPELPLVEGGEVVLVPAVGSAGRATPLRSFADSLAAGTLGYPAANAAPVVSLTSPASNATFAAGATVTITANASDPDDNLAKVEFFHGATKLGEDLTAPYSFTWTNVPAGAYALTARAIDAAGLTATSAAVNITVTAANSAPIVALTSPANAATFTAGASVVITATATDPDNNLAKVEFFQGATKLGEDLTAPYSFTWTNVPAGVYSLTARATDAAGLSATSSAVNITVAVGNSAPTVALTSPANAATFAAGASISIAVNATDPDNNLAKVEFFQGATKLGEDLTAPYNFSWANVPAGTYTLTARATDAAGLTATSAAVSITVNTGGATTGLTGDYYDGTNFDTLRFTRNDATVDFTWGAGGPGNGVSGSAFSVRWQGKLEAPATTTLTLCASSDDGMRINVNGVNVADNYYSHTGVTTSCGAVSVVAGTKYDLSIDYYNQGATATAQLRWWYSGGNFEVVPTRYLSPRGAASGLPPSVSITSPANNASFNAPASLVINANATDPDGNLARVEFYNGATKLGEDTTAPYSFTWSNVPAGAYTINVRAIDTTSLNAQASVNVTINTVGNTGTGLKGEYFTGLDFTGLALTRTDAQIDFNWGAASPGAGVPAGTFAVRWTGKVEAPATEEVVFCAGADDGIRVRINGAVVVENYYDHPFQTTCGSIAMTAGQKYTVAIDYYSKGAPAAAKLEWWYPSGGYQLVPTRYLFPQ